MTICAKRSADSTDAVVCNVDLGDGKRGCWCRVQVEDDIERAETRIARVPDSVREGAA